MKMQKIKASYRDPSSYVYTDSIEDKIFRKLVFEPSIYNQFTEFPKVLGKIAEDIFEIEKIKFLSYYYEWSFEEFKESAIFYLNFLKQVEREGWTLSDATPSNLTYIGNGRFVFIDHGSLIKKNNNHWQGYLQFVKEFAYPLLYLSESHLNTPLQLLPLINNSDWPFTYKAGFDKFFSFRYLMLKSALILSNKKTSLNNQNKIFESGTNINKFNIEFFLDLVKSFSSKKIKTKWDNYYSDTVLGFGYVELKQKIVIEFLRIIDSQVQYAVDFGASTGKVTQAISSQFNQICFIAIESDSEASKELYYTSKIHNIIPVYANLLQLSPSSGLNGVNKSLPERLKKINDLSIALGIIHHMMHAQNMSFKLIIEYFSELSRDNSFLIIEYVSPDDERYKLIRNPNYPFSENLNDFENELQNRFEIIQKRHLSNERYLFLAQKK